MNRQFAFGSAIPMLLLQIGLARAAAPPATQPTIAQKSEALAERWKDRFAAEKFNIVIAPPYVIAGDGTREQLEAYRDGTVLAAQKALQAQYFHTPIDEPILILLFESEEPYKRLAKTWLDDDDVSHFGYYRHDVRAMVMNVSTGTGTLVHELTHALIAPDFPEVPDWFNEGLASLYEQSQFGADGKSIKGLVNWRLPPLEKAIREKTLRTLPELIGDANFRDKDLMVMNYAQARYLMLYLQEKGILRKFYVDFRANRKEDPTGIATLKKLIAPLPIDSFEKAWRQWVLTLKLER